MSTANMWSDDSDAASSTQHQPAAAPHHHDLSYLAQENWVHFPANDSENGDTRPAEMVVDDETFHTTTNTVAWQTLLANDDDDDYLDDDGDVDIVGVTNILSQGMVSEQDLVSFNPVATSSFSDHNTDHIAPMAPPIAPALVSAPTNYPDHPFGFLAPDPIPHTPEPTPTNASLQTLHQPAPPTTHAPEPPPANGPLPLFHPPLNITATWMNLPGAVGQGGAPQGWHAPDASLLHFQHHLAIPHPHHLQNLNPNAASNPHATALGPENYDLNGFVRFWAYQYASAWPRSMRDTRFPLPKSIEPQMTEPVSRVEYADLEGDRRDVQGLNWDDLGVTRSDARERRLLTYKNYVNLAGSDRWQENHDVLPCTENYFRFRRLDVRKNVNLVHFQLRNVLASTSRSQVFYPGMNSVHEYNPITRKGKLGMRSRETPQFQVSTLAAAHGILVAGGFLGEYCFRRTSPEGSGHVHEGTITTDNSGITNHVQLHLSRSSAGPKASFASNDNGFRVLDIATDKFVSETWFEKPINCTAMSPDLRLRVVVGDQKEVLITKAEPDGKPEILHALDGHGDFGFSCAWADDGWTVATGFQDKAVKIWDARRWTDAQGRAIPVCTLRSELAGCRSLKFSPLGSGKRVLVAAEEADFVSIYNAQTWQSKQTFDFFGEIGGTSFVNEGQDLQILCTDRTRGGLFHLERCGIGAERSHAEGNASYSHPRAWKNGSYDWPEFDTTSRLLPRHSETHRRRRALAVAPLDLF